jgi:outer membrane protein TolC
MLGRTKIRIERESLRERVQALVVLAQDNIATARPAVQPARDGLAAAQSAFDLSHDRFQAGVGLELEVLDAEASLQKARTDLVAAIADYNQAQVRLLQAWGPSHPSLLLK